MTFISVNLGSHRATLRWRSSQIKLSTILKKLHQIGYHSQPFHHHSHQSAQAQLRRKQWLRLGVAAMVMMQAGMFSFALYSGEFTGIAVEHKRLLQILGLIMTAPVMLFCATPFFFGAWRSLRAGQVGMDVPVSLALCIAFAASTVTAFSGRGEVYFDSISMFIFLLLLARFAESSARQHFFASEVASWLPLKCRVRDDHHASSSQLENHFQEKKLTDVALNAHVQVRVGEIIPFDGVVIEGQSCVNESTFSGESLPVLKKMGDPVYAGTINGESLLIIQVKQRLGKARIDVITHLAEQNEVRKPAIAELTHRVAQYFSVLVLMLAVVSGVYWWLATGWQHAIVISILVVSCPCALSLATPAALTFCYQALRKQGLWVISGELMARMKTISVLVLDKTGTLTKGVFQLQAFQLTPQAIALHYQPQQVKEIAAALESISGHPMASAFQSIATDWQAHEVMVASGMGVEGVIAGQRYRIGSRQFCEQWCPVADQIDYPATTQPIYLAKPDALLAIFNVQDTLREDAAEVVSTLQQQGLHLVMLSGDSSGAAQQIAQQLGIRHYHTGLSPEQKLEQLIALQQKHSHAEMAGVMMVGDGINDIPVLAQADVAIAMNAASDLAKVQADAILLRNQLTPLLALFQHCKATRRVIYQNLFWALLYNGLSLPAAAMGWMPPWVAAIGMSMSSLLVTINSLRLRKIH